MRYSKRDKNGNITEDKIEYTEIILTNAIDLLKKNKNNIKEYIKDSINKYDNLWQELTNVLDDTEPEILKELEKTDLDKLIEYITFDKDSIEIEENLCNIRRGTICFNLKVTFDLYKYKNAKQ